jgi:putative ABC transport system ATP-binding protein/lipoprotein-releasing system ATP-binding protein
METVIAAEGVHRSYELGKTRLEVLKGVDVEIAAGEHVFLCGASGAGKTTLMYTLAGLEKPQQGKVMIEGKDLYRMGRAQQAAVRNARMGYIFQNYYLLPELTAQENVMVPGMIGGKADLDRANELLDAVGLSKRREHLPSELSGGEQQRVAIARALVNGPAMVFADEPTGNLDSKNGAEVMKLLLGFAGEMKTTLVVVTHDHELAKMGDRILTIKDGRIV